MTDPKTEPQAVEPELITTTAEELPQPGDRAPAGPKMDSPVEPDSGLASAPDPFANIPGDGPAANGSTTPAADGFKPFYHREARRQTAARAALLGLLAVLGLSLVTLAFEAWWRNLPIKLDLTTMALIWAALTGILWKKISLKTKVGLGATALGLGLILVAGTGNQLTFFLPPGTLFPLTLSLGLLATLVACWLPWRRLHWAPGIFTLLALYAALASVWPLIFRTGQSADILGPAFLAGWPTCLRPGWILGQVVLPLGALSFLALQARCLLKPQYDRHFGHVFWALGLIFLATTSLIGLEKAQAPVYPSMSRILAKTYPARFAMANQPIVPTGPGQALAPAAKVPAAKAPAIPPTPAESQPGQKPSTSSTDAGPDASRTPEAATAAKPALEKPAPGSASPPSPAEKESSPIPEVKTDQDREKIDLLEEKVRNLENDLERLKTRLANQEKLLRALLEYFGTRDHQNNLDEGDEPQVPPDDDPEGNEGEGIIPPKTSPELT